MDAIDLDGYDTRVIDFGEQELLKFLCDLV